MMVKLFRNGLATLKKLLRAAVAVLALLVVAVLALGLAMVLIIKVPPQPSKNV